jgi:tRNA(fMet)-specific endonuclease VapC
MRYAFGSNTIIHLMRGNQNVRENRKNAQKRGNTFIIPPFVNYEILRGFLCVSAPSKERAYKQLCACCPIGEMTTAAWVQAAEIYAQLYKKRFTVKDADIVIAAFCTVNSYTLVTSNTKDFENIDGLSYEDWTVNSETVSNV